jgi:RNA polymerase sigma-70 factor (ECF subfamily)
MDLVQEIILKLWRSFDSYNAAFKYSTWIYRVALNTAISLYRKNKQGNRKTEPFPDNIINIAVYPDDSQMDQNTILLNKFIHELKPLDKALVLLYLEEKSQKEIAEIMGITETNVSTKIARIKNILKQKFTQIKP